MTFSVVAHIRCNWTRCTDACTATVNPLHDRVIDTLGSSARLLDRSARHARSESSNQSAEQSERGRDRNAAGSILLMSACGPSAAFGESRQNGVSGERSMAGILQTGASALRLFRHGPLPHQSDAEVTC